MKSHQTLEAITARAQRDANAERKLLTIWNLNRYSPLYVIRYARDGDADRDGFVATIQPQEPNNEDS